MFSDKYLIKLKPKYYLNNQMWLKLHVCVRSWQCVLAFTVEQGARPQHTIWWRHQHLHDKPGGGNASHHLSSEFDLQLHCSKYLYLPLCALCFSLSISVSRPQAPGCPDLSILSFMGGFHGRTMGMFNTKTNHYSEIKQSHFRAPLPC